MNDSTSTAATGKGNMIWGILMLICGFLAITLPLASGIGVAIVIGWLLLISGVWHLLFGFRSGSGVGGFLWQLLLAIVYGAAGLMLLFYPLAGLAWLTLVLATFLLIEAALEFVLCFLLFVIRWKHERTDKSPFRLAAETSRLAACAPQTKTDFRNDCCRFHPSFFSFGYKK